MRKIGSDSKSRPATNDLTIRLLSNAAGSALDVALSALQTHSMRRIEQPLLWVLVLAAYVWSERVVGVHGGYYTADEYGAGDELPLAVTQLVSQRTRLAYEYRSAPLCALGSDQPDSVLRLSTLFFGERAWRTMHDARLFHPQRGVLLCKMQLTASQLRVLRKRVMQECRVHYIVDGFRVVQDADAGTAGAGSQRAHVGVDLGTRHHDDEVVLYNHVSFLVQLHEVGRDQASDMGRSFGKALYRRDQSPNQDASLLQSSSSSPSGKYRIAGLKARVESRAYTPDGPLSVDNAGVSSAQKYEPLVLPTGLNSNAQGQSFVPVAFTYDVSFENVALDWVSPLDPLVLTSEHLQRGQLLSIANSILLVLSLALMMGTILLRTLRRQFKAYAALGASSGSGGGTTFGIEAFDDSGLHGSSWRNLREDVFRPPRNPLWLSVLVAAGAQLVLVAFCTIVTAYAGVVSRQHRGDLVIALVVAWVLTSGLNGFVAAQLYFLFGRQQWQHASISAAFVFPLFVFALFWAINCTLWVARAISAAPFAVQLVLLFCWLFISVPLCLAGGWLAARRRVNTFTVYSNAPLREIPKQEWYVGTPLVLLAGLLPFGVVAAQLYTILQALWQGNAFHHMFGFLLVVFVLTLLVSAQVGVALVYVKISQQDHEWWWPGFCAAGSSGLYVFLYSAFYLVTSDSMIKVGFASSVLFLGYALLASVAFALLTGSVGLGASFAFLRWIYWHVRAS
ncbi:Transmembrane 9 superfamily member 8 [Porphyridium purpureum]|uniref:Transmembrane 9 superfamily member n=1 Tax=Porphyridium purpureum TaxID=35688 RepID=A0A5J4YZU6_PORPP|nr:Transmembrane 9 superfamily member 8 [Porphyridium purpureum]|eukprot:POR4381..scf208_2